MCGRGRKLQGLWRIQLQPTAGRLFNVSSLLVVCSSASQAITYVPVCVPSRASLLTGVSAEANKITSGADLEVALSYKTFIQVMSSRMEGRVGNGWVTLLLSIIMDAIVLTLHCMFDLRGVAGFVCSGLRDGVLRQMAQ